jgi:plastocyanin
MSILGRKISGKALAVLVVMMVVGTLLPVMTNAPAREIVLVARDMSFYLDGDFEHPNPVIAVKAGERVRIVMRNEERGMTHDFAVPAVGARTALLTWNEQRDVTFEVPGTPGAYEYRCTPHSLMMKGTLQVY